MVFLPLLLDKIKIQHDILRRLQEGLLYAIIVLYACHHGYLTH